MFDFHTHILPDLDDGSQSVKESLEMLSELKKQGITGVAATPHFYPDSMLPEIFFAERNASFEKICPHLTPDMPKIRLGAEIGYYEGITEMENISDFCIQGTELLLVEMPASRWTARMIDTIVSLHRSERVTVLLAHVERYMRSNPVDAFDMLLQSGILMQVSADFFTTFFLKKKGIKLMAQGKLHLLGTDCHNMTSRKPNMKPATDYIVKKLGEKFMGRYLAREKRLLNE